MSSEFPTCPNPKCIFHNLGYGGTKSCLQRDGFYQRQSFPKKVQRYRCKSCGAKFSESTFAFECWNRRLGLFHHIFRLFCEGCANRQIARLLSIDEKTVRLRLRKIAQHAMLEHTYRTRFLKIHEPVAYDGVENFARSQYEPNNINQAIGYNSHFIYDFNFATLNRKGYESPRQTIRKAEIEAREGIFPRSAIRQSSAVIFERLAGKCDDPAGLELLTDKSIHYDKAIRRDLKHIKFRHHTISSKAPRVFKHILFPVNHLDMLLRHHNKSFTRETISFSKTHGAMIQRYALVMVWKNYFRTQFTKRHKLNPRANIDTPAMVLGLTDKPVKFFDFFDRVKKTTQVSMNAEWLKFYEGAHTYPRLLTG